MVRFGLKTTQESVMEDGLIEAGVEWDPSAGWRQDRDLVHEPSRLQIMAMALRDGGATFQNLRIKLGLSDADVATQAKRLEAAGLLESTKAVGGTGMVITFAVTRKGQQVMEGYCDWMRDILQGLPGTSG